MGNMSDIINRTEDNVELLPVVMTATKTGTGIDKQGFDGTCHIIAIGDSGDTLSGSVYFTLKLEDSDDDSTYAAAVTADVIGQTLTAGVFDTIDAPAEDSKNVLIQYVGKARYSRVVVTITGTHTNGTPIGIVALNVGPRHIPA